MFDIEDFEREFWAQFYYIQNLITLIKSNPISITEAIKLNKILYDAIDRWHGLAQKRKEIIQA